MRKQAKETLKRNVGIFASCGAPDLPEEEVVQRHLRLRVDVLQVPPEGFTLNTPGRAQGLLRQKE